MRAPRVVVVLTLLFAVLSACAPRMAPVPVVETPKYPEFLAPVVPPGLAADRAARHQDPAWAFLQAGDLRNAEREVTAALRASPTFYPAETIAGYVRLARGDAKAALARFDASLARAGSASAYLGRGQALAALEREPEAIAALEAALAVDPGLAAVSRQIEVLRFRALERDLAGAREAARSDRLDEAAHAYQAALASSPESAFLFRELGDVERRQGRQDEALAHFRRAVELDAYDASSLVQIAALLEDREDWTGALLAYDQALAIDPVAATAERRDAVRRRLDLATLPAEYQAIEGASEVTRGQLAALLGVRLAHVLTPTRESVVMTDVRGQWAEPWIVAVAQAGVIDPFANHTFQPDLPVRRVDLAQTVVQLLTKIADPGEMRSWQISGRTFSDLSTGHLAHAAALVAVASGVMMAGPGDAFEPSMPVTGAEAVVAVERLAGMAGVATPGSVGR
jgi:tetratricopeptide (TPR) repeat protein